MTGRTDHVLDAIDSALADHTVSGDAMRYAPDAGDPPLLRVTGGRVFVAPVGAPGPLTTDRWTEVGRVKFPLDELRVVFEIGTQVRDAMLNLQHAFNQTHHLHLDLPTDPADDESVVEESPRDRALRLRRARNTGPHHDPHRHHGEGPR